MKCFLRVIRRSSLQTISIVCLLCVSTAVYSEIEKTLKFIPDRFDFGRIKEDNGKVERMVKAINISSDTTFIISARTSCGCSAAEYSDEAIAPGDTTEVTLTYDPANRPGKFLKTARFFTGQERIGNSIKMTGTVIPSKKNLDFAYPDKAGNLRMSTLFINAGELSQNEVRPLFVGLYNDSDNPLPVSVVTDTGALEAAIMPDTIEAYGIATITLMLKGRNVPVGTTEINYKVALVNTAGCDTIVSIPVIGRFAKINLTQ